MDEAELLQRCLAKDKKAWDIFVQRYAKLIYWAIRRRLHASSFDFTSDDVQNIFQEVFLTLLEGHKLSQLRNPRYLGSWLALVASNKAVDFMRQKIRSNQRFVSQAPVLKDDESAHELFDNDTERKVYELLDTLSGREKIIMSLYLLEKRKYREIAQMLSIPINTVSTIIARTKDKLKIVLRKIDTQQL